MSNKTSRMKTYPIIYKKTSHGKTQQWQIEQEQNRYRTISGQTDGKKITSEWTVCKGKNIGRSNETSPEDQCTKEIESLYRKQFDRGYVENVQDVQTTKITRFEPMLAKTYEDYKQEEFILNDSLLVQPKLDGIRCLVQANRIFSRKNKDFVSVPHILEACQKFFDVFPNAVLDGELYNHKFKADFNEITSIVKKLKPSAADLSKSKQFIQYWIYDVYFPSNPGINFNNRINVLKEFFDSTDLSDNLILVPTYDIQHSAIDDVYDSCIEDGFEGMMIRNASAAYQQKRTKDLLKYKTMIDEEYEIVELIEGEGNLSGCAGAVVCKITVDGNEDTFRAGIKGSRSFIRQLWKDRNELIGLPATIQYFNLTPGGKPRFGKLKTIRNYE